MDHTATAAAADTSTATFSRLRPRLQGVAYRMLGSRAEAEEVVQDAWLRWHEADHAALQSAEAWLVTVTSRLALDRLRAAKAQREHYVGFWLPEPLVEDSPPSPQQLLERCDDLSVAFLTVLERLSPEARVAFLLREVFDADYAELARVLDKSEDACRQLVSRAKTQLRDARRRHAVPHDTQRRLLQGFIHASSSGDFAALQSLLAEDAQLLSDGGGKVPSFGKVLQGGRRIAQLFLATKLRHGALVQWEMAVVNGEWGLLRFVDGRLESVQALETDGQRILRIHVQRNPDKLARIAAAWERAKNPAAGVTSALPASS
ncbi:RNA polymerase sigma-70 factor [Azohydromonas lata]|uniref:RNA polymerase sigma-70 factor n=1 Tax=Azohydromonas lata TaxID=45677 RepID=UPI00082C20E0|nr:RNA polymerase sigma-70 factor [Azohydromonas lata]